LAAALSQTTGIAVSGAGADSTNEIHSGTRALVQNSALTASGKVTITAEAGSAAASKTLTPSGNAADFVTNLDDASKTDMLDSDLTIGSTLYKEGTPNPNDVSSDNSFKTTLRNLLA